MKRVLILPILVGGLSSLALAAHPDVVAMDKAPVMNQMVGTIQGVDPDNHVVRLQTDNGFNVEFTYDKDTAVKGIGVSKEVSSLAYKDQVTIRYVGRDLIAREIEKRSLQPAMASSTPTLPAN